MNLTSVRLQNEINHQKQDPMIKTNLKEENTNEKAKYKLKIVWRNVIAFTYLHLGSLYGLYLIFTSAKSITTIFAIMLYPISGLGVTGGAHRLWAHKSYKAKWPLKFILMILNTMTFQDAVIIWARDHRVHHKYTDTDADPYNSKRGFFFSHMGWLMCRKHPEVLEKGKNIDLSDLYNEPFLVFQKKYYFILMPFFCFILPTIVPVYLWNETWSNAFYIPTLLRYTFTLHITWLVNSAAHKFGVKPYDKNITPTENKFVSYFAGGEGWHNFHHCFPWDYRSAELGSFSTNITKYYIELFAKIGWAYDLKVASPELIKSVIENKGDKTHSLFCEVSEPQKED